jgi:predicted MFS family arabinose efflux permease
MDTAACLPPGPAGNGRAVEGAPAIGCTIFPIHIALMLGQMSTMPEGRAAGGASALLSRRYRTWFVLVLLLLSMLNYADRAILSVLAQPIKEDLKLTDGELGMLSGLGFAILYSLLGLPIGWLAERVNRRNLIAVCVAAWSLMTAACGLAGSFFSLLLGRVGVGIGEAGFQPPVSSLVADQFKADRRGTVMSIILLGSPLGFLLGQAVGGWVASQWGWRVAFFTLGVPGALAALIVWLTLKEPPRGLADGRVNVDAAPSLKEAIKTMWSKPTFRHLLFAFVIAGFAMNAVAQFVLPFYLRSFNLPLATVGALFGMVAFSSNGLGMLLGGMGFDRLSRRDARWPLWGPAAMLFVAMPLYLLAFRSVTATASFAFIWFANLTMATHLAPSLSMVQNVAPPRMRATATALVWLVMGLIGTGFGPTLMGFASDYFATNSFEAGNFIHSCPGGRAPAGAQAALDAACRAASTQGLRMAMACGTVFFLWSSVHFLLASRTVRRDLYLPPTA